jgi:hypothetical protein
MSASGKVREIEKLYAGAKAVGKSRGGKSGGKGGWQGRQAVGPFGAPAWKRQGPAPGPPSVWAGHLPWGRVAGGERVCAQQAHPPWPTAPWAPAAALGCKRGQSLTLRCCRRRRCRQGQQAQGAAPGQAHAQRPEGRAQGRHEEAGGQGRPGRQVRRGRPGRQGGWGRPGGQVGWGRSGRRRVCQGRPGRRVGRGGQGGQGRRRWRQGRQGGQAVRCELGMAGGGGEGGCRLVGCNGRELDTGAGSSWRGSARVLIVS